MEVITLSNRLHDIIRSAQVDPNDIRIIESSSVLYLWNNDINHYMDEAGISYNSALNRILETYNTRNKDYCVVYPEDLYISENTNYSSEYETIQAIFEADEKLALKDVKNVGERKIYQKSIDKILRNVFKKKHPELNLDTEQKIKSYYDKSIKECNNAIKKIDDELNRIKTNNNSQSEFSADFFDKLIKNFISFGFSLLKKDPIFITYNAINMGKTAIDIVYTYRDYEGMLNTYKNKIESCKNTLEKDKQDEINKLSKRRK